MPQEVMEFMSFQVIEHDWSKSRDPVGRATGFLPGLDTHRRFVIGPDAKEHEVRRWVVRYVRSVISDSFVAGPLVAQGHSQRFVEHTIR